MITAFFVSPLPADPAQCRFDTHSLSFPIRFGWPSASANMGVPSWLTSVFCMGPCAGLTCYGGRGRRTVEPTTGSLEQQPHRVEVDCASGCSGGHLFAGLVVTRFASWYLGVVSFPRQTKRSQNRPASNSSGAVSSLLSSRTVLEIANTWLLKAMQGLVEVVLHCSHKLVMSLELT
ncbi:unnamed protein product [Protopolystoma xenopodis]|uniref:Uncharacterized protein n=1 Tax=Protopolystoma xenopodis TaxID=117903 RepID=A0A448X971_9PLAT|nr:unnamed protein product [Protopolystoma xenopodis]